MNSGPVTTQVNDAGFGEGAALGALSEGFIEVTCNE